MTTALRAESEGEAAEQAGATQALDDLRLMTGAVAVVLRDSVVKFEQTVERITEIVALRAGQPERDLVVTLQAFDRLQQEFTALGLMLGRLFVQGDNSERGDDYRVPSVDDVVAAIALSDLRERIQSQLGTRPSSVVGVEEEAVF